MTTTYIVVIYVALDYYIYSSICCAYESCQKSVEKTILRDPDMKILLAVQKNITFVITT